MSGHDWCVVHCVHTVRGGGKKGGIGFKISSSQIMSLLCHLFASTHSRETRLIYIGTVVIAHARGANLQIFYPGRALVCVSTRTHATHANAQQMCVRTKNEGRKRS